MVTQDRDTEWENLDEGKQGFKMLLGREGEDPEPSCPRTTWFQCVRISCKLPSDPRKRQAEPG